ncbi:lipase maturation factor 2-like isoform X2 [Daphnia carinata]|uniref:lipase maturation factor 2-like isoform X2 n=1 Tax=Daphnia carinata TaxID=120202 RepID=UPI00257E4E65|nr:lipase maturation factor 2-like isoform X2 [Daphnia carinata]
MYGSYISFCVQLILCANTRLFKWLYGPNGILPSHANLGIQDERHVFDKFWENPTLLHLAPMFGLTVSYCMELFALTGILLSFLGLVYQKICNLFVFFTLWLLYLSLYKVGQTFLHFQWDIMLLESGFITIVVAPIIYSKKRRTTPRDRLCFWLVKWLLFRLMFASGVVKLTSKCPTWWNLSALTVHYESQCIPNPLSWYFHQSPVWFHKLSVVATYVIEIALPFLFFAPFRKLRLFSCYGQILLQVMIIASGNYNFFNLVTITLCFSLMDDRHLFGVQNNKKAQAMENIVTGITLGLLIYFTVLWFGIDLGKEVPIHSEIRFSAKEFEAALKLAVPASIAIGATSFFFVACTSLYDLVFRSRSSLFEYILNVIQYVACFTVAVFLFGISLVPYSTLNPATRTSLPAFLNRWHGQFDQFHLTSSYGLFRSMTGVGGRPEVILEGATELQGPYNEISFKYKPGQIERPCSFIVPHQPRLDWQMWFAALGTYHHNPWLVSLAYRILTNESDVINLLDSNIYNEFEEDWPPKYIKGSLYTYRYTSSSDHSDTGNWWKRTRVSDYLPIFSSDHEPLIKYLENQRILGQPDITLTNTLLASFLDKVWVICNATEPHIFIWALLVSSFVVTRLS